MPDLEVSVPDPARVRGSGVGPLGAAAAGVAGLYALLVPYHFVILSGSARTIMVVSTSTSVVVLALIFAWVSRAHRAGRALRAPNLLLALVVAVPLSNCLLDLGVSGQPRQTAALMLAVAAVGATVSPWGLAVAMVGATDLVGAVLVSGLALTHEQLVSYVVGMAAASLIAGILYRMRDRRERELRDTTARLAEQVRIEQATRHALQESEERFRSVFNASPVGIALCESDLTLVAVNAALCALLGRSESELVGQSGAEFAHSDEKTAHQSAAERLDAALGGPVQAQTRYVRPDGSVRWAWLTAVRTPGPDGSDWLLAQVEDVTDRVVAEQALNRAKGDLFAIHDVVRRIDSGSDARAAVVRAACDVAGAASAHLLERDGAHHVKVVAAIGASLSDVRIRLDDATATGMVFRSGEMLFLADPGESPLVSPTLLALSGARSMLWHPITHRGKVTALLIVAWDERVSDREDRQVQAIEVLAREAAVALENHRLLQQLATSATTDALTSVLNRRGWEESLVACLQTAKSEVRPLTVAIADLDHFKAFNDSYGHPAGDAMLVEFAEAATDVLRHGDVIARWGGEEFAIALPDCGPVEAAQVLERVRLAMPVGQTCSIGHATWDMLESGPELLARADRALYIAKRNGRDQLASAASHRA